MKAAPAHEKRPAMEPKPPPAAAPAPRPAAGPAAAGSMNDALRAFLEGAGMPHKELSAAQSERLLRDCGTVLRAAVEGLMMLLIAPGEMRKEFEAEERTMSAARGTQPLQLMANPQDGLTF